MLYRYALALYKRSRKTQSERLQNVADNAGSRLDGSQSLDRRRARERTPAVA